MPPLISKAGAVRLGAALALVVGALVHLQLYFAAYRRFPDPILGRSFLLNAVTSTAVATALVVRPHRLVAVLGIIVAAGTLVAFAITRSSDALFGFQETGLRPSPQAAIALVAEIAAVILLAISLMPAWASVDTDPPHPELAIPSIALLALTPIVLAGYWSHRYQLDERPEVVA